VPLTSRIREINQVDTVQLEKAISNLDDMLSFVRRAVISRGAVFAGKIFAKIEIFFNSQ